MALDGEDTKTATMPTLFIPHGGGPCFFMDWSPADTWKKTEAWLRGLADTLPERPKAIVVISGHWEEPVFTVGTSPAPGMIYDYSNFPPHTYELQYPAPGAPALAAHIVGLLRKHGLPAGTDATRGFDHGVFVPFLLVFPDAEIPVVPMSLKSDLNPAEHMAAGQALASLRDGRRADRGKRHELSQHARLQHAVGHRSVGDLRPLADRSGGGRSRGSGREPRPLGRSAVRPSVASPRGASPAPDGGGRRGGRRQG